VTLSVENMTNDLEPGEFGKIFEPLWTKSADRSTGWAGLGSALVADYVRVLNPAVNSSFELGTTRFIPRVAFPR
jgi:hypothetical protein